MGIFRRDFWPGLPPTIKKDRVMCDQCAHHTGAVAGWQWDRCHHPLADMGSVVRNDQKAKCCDMRYSSDQCGESGKWFTPKSSGNVIKG